MWRKEFDSEFDYIKHWLLKGIIVYSFGEEGNCPNCNRILTENQFGNWIYEYCAEQDLFNHKEYITKLMKKWEINL